MAADAQEGSLAKVDSAISEGTGSPTETKGKHMHKRASSSSADVYNVNDLGK